jgi:anion-transporting  ArsA/GET3 family ATPase
VDLLDRRLLLVTGKGGVGKSTVAAALAVLAAEQGKRTLLCEVDAKGALGACLESRDRVEFAPREVLPGLWLMAMDTEESLREYLSLNLRVPLVTRLGPLAKALDFLAAAAPGVKELLVVGKLCWEVRERHFDLVIADASATGHIVGQLSSAQAVSELVRVGVVRAQTRWMLELLSDPLVTGLVVVATPEEMPVTETLELVARLDAETGVDLAAVAVNRLLPELFGRSEEAVFDQLVEGPMRDALAAGLGGDPAPVLEAAALAVRLRRSGVSHVERLRAGIDERVPMLYLPYLFARMPGMRATRQMAEALAAELGSEG